MLIKLKMKFQFNFKKIWKRIMKIIKTVKEQKAKFKITYKVKLNNSSKIIFNYQMQVTMKKELIQLITSKFKRGKIQIVI